MARREIELLRVPLRILRARRLRGGRELLDPNIEFNLGTPDYEATPAHGPEEIEQQIREFLANGAAYRIEVEEFWTPATVCWCERVSGGSETERRRGRHAAIRGWTFREAKVVRITSTPASGRARGRRLVPSSFVKARTCACERTDGRSGAQPQDAFRVALEAPDIKGRPVVRV